MLLPCPPMGCGVVEIHLEMAQPTKKHEQNRLVKPTYQLSRQKVMLK